MRKIKTDYTTGDAAKICRISQQTIIRGFDKGLFEDGYRVPGSKFRRIPPKSLYKYMKQHNLSTDNFPAEDLPKEGLESCATE